MCWVVQLYPILCNPLAYSLPGSYVHGIFQARIPEWVAISSSRGSSRPRAWTHISYVSCIAGRFFTCWALREALEVALAGMFVLYPILKGMFSITSHVLWNLTRVSEILLIRLKKYFFSFQVSKSFCHEEMFTAVFLHLLRLLYSICPLTCLMQQITLTYFPKSNQLCIPGINWQGMMCCHFYSLEDSFANVWSRILSLCSQMK